MFNERKTESLVRSRFQEVGNLDDVDVRVEEQKSDFPRINKFLQRASKKGERAGYPDFIVSSAKHSDFLVVVECKPDETKHISKGNYKDSKANKGILP